MAPNLEPEELFARFLADGDHNSLNELFSYASPPLLRLARRLGHCEADAEDLVQETMVTAIGKASEFESHRSLLAWLKGILARKAAHLARARQRQDQRITALAADHDPQAATAPTPADAAIDDELVRTVQRALTMLPAHLAQPLELYLREGMSPVEIAAHLQRDRSTIRTQIHRGLQKLRAALPASTSLGILVTTLRAAARAPKGPLPGVSSASGPMLSTTRILAAGLLLAASWLVLSLLGHDIGPSTATPDEPTATREAPIANRDNTADRVRALSSGTDQATGRQLVITVVDGLDRPIPHVGVVVEPHDEIDPLAHDHRRVTDHRGQSVFTKLEPRIYAAWIDRRQRLVVDLEAGNHATIVERRVQVTGGVEVSGRVIGMDEAPVAGASIWLGPDSQRAWAGGVVCRSDGEGRFRLTAVQPGSILAAWSSSLGGSGFLTVGSYQAREITVRLAMPGQVVRGRVSTETGHPIAGARIVIGKTPATADHGLADGVWIQPFPPRHARSDEHGRFRVEGLTRGSHPLVIRQAGFAPYGRFLHLDGQLREEERIRLKPSASIDGRVVDPEGQAIAGASVTLRGTDRHECASTKSNASGHFRFDCVPASRVMVRAQIAGSLPSTRTCRGARDDLILELRPLIHLRGQLLDADREPLSAFQVRANFPSARGDIRVQKTTDAEGQFEMAVPRPVRVNGRPLLMVREPGATLFCAIDETARWFDADQRVEVVFPERMRANARLQGTLLTHAGEVMRNAKVYLRHDDGLTRGIFFELGRTRPNGEIDIDRIPSGHYTVFAESLEPEQPSGHFGSGYLQPSQTTRLDLRCGATGRVEFDLTLPNAGGTNSVLTRDCVLTIVGDRLRQRHTRRTASRGFQVLPEGRYKLYAMGHGFAWINGLPFEVTANRTVRVKRQLEAAIRRVINVQNWSAMPPARRARAWLRTTGDREYGDFQIDLEDPTPLSVFLPPGEYRLTVAPDSPNGEKAAVWHAGFRVENLQPRFRAISLRLERK